MDFIIPRSALPCVAPVSVTAFRILLTLVAFDAAAAAMNEPLDQEIAWPLRDVASAAGFSTSNAARTLRNAAEELAAHPWVETIAITPDGLAWRLHPALRPRLWYDEPYLRASLDDFRACADVLDVQFTLIHRLVAGMRRPEISCGVAPLLTLRGLANDEAGWAALRPAVRASVRRLAAATNHQISVTLAAGTARTPQTVLLRMAPAFSAVQPGFTRASPLDEHWLVYPDRDVVRRPRARRIVAEPATPSAATPALTAPDRRRPLLQIAEKIFASGVGFVDVRVMLAELLQIVDERTAVNHLERAIYAREKGLALKRRIERVIEALGEADGAALQRTRGRR